MNLFALALVLLIPSTVAYVLGWAQGAAAERFDEEHRRLHDDAG